MIDQATALPSLRRGDDSPDDDSEAAFDGVFGDMEIPLDGI